MSNSSPRRSSRSVTTLVIVVTALVLWFLFFRPQPPSETGNSSGATPPATLQQGEQPAQTPESTSAVATVAIAPTTSEVEPPTAVTPATASTTATLQPAAPKATPTRGPPATIDGLPVITQEALPPEAIDTLALIASDGPFPFSKDGAVFQNREQLLPRKSSGYYHEFTVITPGENDRGARRIVAGDGGELYYTDDHYASFSRIWVP